MGAIVGSTVGLSVGLAVGTGVGCAVGFGVGLVHSDPDAAFATQYWFAKHTSSSHVHAAVFAADPSVLEQAPQLERLKMECKQCG